MRTGFAALNEEHERLLRSDVAAWNAWRVENPSARPDLHKANLSGSNLQHANLDHAYLYGANLERAILHGATFRDADIRFANFARARLVEADMRWSDATKSDMSEANLSSADLRRMTFREVNLSAAVLAAANLGESTFFGANLDRVVLRKVNLQGVHLGCATFIVQATRESINLAEGTHRVGHLPKDEIGGAAEFVTHEKPANLTSADLSSAIAVGANITGMEMVDCDFRGAVLIGTDLTDASFNQCDLGGSVWGGAIVNSTNLAGARGLATARHVKPSKLSIDTIIASKGLLPDLFIRGCGYHPNIQKRVYLTDDAELEANTAPSDLKLASCFMSYSSKDHSFAAKLSVALNAAGVEYWYDHEHMIDGGGIADQIDRAIAAHTRMVLVCSESSLESGWVALEIEKALKEEHRRKVEGDMNWRVLFPLMLDDSFFDARDARIAELRKDRRASDFRRWKDPSEFEASFNRLLEGLRRTP